MSDQYDRHSLDGGCRPRGGVALRLTPPAARLDFWTGGFWSDHARVRQRHRAELAELRAVLHLVAPDRPLIIGGDFDAPAADAAFDELRGVRDVFARTGRGWPHTGTNEVPLFRVDLVWANDEWIPLRSWAVAASRGARSMFNTSTAGVRLRRV